MIEPAMAQSSRDGGKYRLQTQSVLRQIGVTLPNISGSIRIWLPQEQIWVSFVILSSYPGFAGGALTSSAGQATVPRCLRDDYSAVFVRCQAGGLGSPVHRAADGVQDGDAIIVLRAVLVGYPVRLGQVVARSDYLTERLDQFAFGVRGIAQDDSYFVPLCCCCVFHDLYSHIALDLSREKVNYFRVHLCPLAFARLAVIAPHRQRG